ncbi:YbgC/FadM family acyl-CoA thioesterase [Parasphingorhabdus sp. DH2-15]|uniref:YbgC/FadM family acyl-CoA thioesterase n=1 Tax=Parasphingorhabdus sp. DH2-15 TaxID=3444112 RepID=UPI003F683716
MTIASSPVDITPFAGQYIDTLHYFAVRVYYEDTDFSGIVYHANYLRYCERARTDMLSRVGIDQRAAFENGIGAYAIGAIDCKYHMPARFDDALLIISTVTRVRAAGCEIQQRVMRGDELVFTADVKAAFLNPKGRPVRQPAQWVEAFRSVLNKDEEFL